MESKYYSFLLGCKTGLYPSKITANIFGNQSCNLVSLLKQFQRSRSRSFSLF